MGAGEAKKQGHCKPFMIRELPEKMTYIGSAYSCLPSRPYIYGFGKGSVEGGQREQYGLWYLTEDSNYNHFYLQGTAVIKYADPPHTPKTCTYLGQVANTKPHGYGKLNEQYGNRIVRIYKGFFKHGVKHGVGSELTYYYYMKTKIKTIELLYEGRFEEGNKNGIGKCSIKYLKDQKETIFYGNWKMGKIHGKALKEKKFVGFLGGTSYLNYIDGQRKSAIKLLKDKNGRKLPVNEYVQITYEGNQKKRVDIQITAENLSPYIDMKEKMPPLFFKEFKTLDAVQLNFIFMNGKLKFRFKPNKQIANKHLFAKGEFLNTYEMALFNFFEYKVYDLLRESQFKHIPTEIDLTYYSIPSFNDTQKPLERFKGDFRDISTEKPILSLMTLDFFEEDYLLSNIMSRMSTEEFSDEFVKALVERLLELFQDLEKLNVFHGSIKEGNIFCFYMAQSGDLNIKLVNFSHANIIANGTINNKFTCAHEGMFNYSALDRTSASNLYALEPIEETKDSHHYETYFFPFDYQKADIFSLNPIKQAIYKDPFEPRNYSGATHNLIKADIFAFAVLILKMFIASLKPEMKAKSKILARNAFFPDMKIKDYKAISTELSGLNILYSIIKIQIDECLEGKYNYFSQIKNFYELNLGNLAHNPLSKEGKYLLYHN